MGDKTFALREAAFKRGWIKGTPEYIHRLEYPGPIIETPCVADETCVRYKGGPTITSYWLCPACQAPDVTVDYKTHAPFEGLVSTEKNTGKPSCVSGILLNPKSTVRPITE